MSEAQLNGQQEGGADSSVSTPSSGSTPSAWWRASSPAAGPPIATWRAYAEVLLVFAAFFGASVAVALLDLAGRLDGASSVVSWAYDGPGAFNFLAKAGLAVLVVVLLAKARGCSASELGLRVRRDDRGRVMFWPEARVTAWAILALLIGGFITSALKSGSIPLGPASAADLVYRSAHAIEAGFMEECVVLAFLVATLRQARRPMWEIVALALLLRVSYHLYYGPGALGILVWAAVFVWIYLRTRSLIPLIIVHCTWDLVATFAPHWRAVGGFWLLGVLVLFVAAPISWLVERTGRSGYAGTGSSRSGYPVSGGPGSAATTGAVPMTAAGWHPDPSGQHWWRWWDGVGWTVAVSDENGAGRLPVASSRDEVTTG